MPDPVKMLKRRIGVRPLREAGREIGCSAAYLSDVLRGLRAPGPTILRYLKLEKQVRTRVTFRRVPPVTAITP